MPNSYTCYMMSGFEVGVMTKSTKNFRAEEFACPCCGRNEIKDSLVDALQALRDLIKKPIIVNSGYRCAKHNQEVGGARNSQHVKGTAADIWVKGMPPTTLAYMAEQIPAFRDGGIGVYPTWVHVDTRGYRARWRG